MSFTTFPAVDKADNDGLLAIGGKLSSDLLLEAYTSGIFPWPFQEKLLAWFAPPKRAILMLDQFHVSRSFSRFILKNNLTVKVNTHFKDVMEACANSNNRKGQSGTWITTGLIKAYCELHKAGFAHSVECFYDKELVGGIYGVSIGGMFAGESMFYTKPNASKFALYSLIKILVRQNVEWMDCQVMTANLKRFGASEISRSRFMGLLSKSLKKPQLKFNADLLYA